MLRAADSNLYGCGWQPARCFLLLQNSPCSPSEAEPCLPSATAASERLLWLIAPFQTSLKKEIKRGSNERRERRKGGKTAVSTGLSNGNRSGIPKRKQREPQTEFGKDKTGLGTVKRDSAKESRGLSRRIGTWKGFTGASTGQPGLGRVLLELTTESRHLERSYRDF